MRYVRFKIETLSSEGLKDTYKLYEKRPPTGIYSWEWCPKLFWKWHLYGIYSTYAEAYSAIKTLVKFDEQQKQANKVIRINLYFDDLGNVTGC